MNILLLHPTSFVEKNQLAVFPLGLASIGTVLEKGGHRVRLKDLNICDNPSQDLKRLLKEDAFDFVCVNMRNLFFRHAPQIDQWRNILKTIKAVSPSSKIAAGGAAFSLLPEEIAGALGEIDIGVIGEGEEAFLELMNKPLSEVKGIVYRSGASLVFAPARERPDFKNLPIPKRDWPDLDLARYSMLNMQTKRGCVFGCRHCPISYLEGTNLRFRDPGSVEEEIKYLDSLGFKKIFIVDNIFNFPVDYSLKVLDILKKFRWEWTGYFKPDFFSKDYIFDLSASGCRNIRISLEGGSDKVNRYLGTSVSEKALLELLGLSGLLRKHKLNLSFGIYIGLPGENPIDFLKTLILAFRIVLKRYSVLFISFWLFPKSEIGEKFRRSRSLTRPPFYRKRLALLFSFLLVLQFKILPKLLGKRVRTGGPSY